MVQASNKKKIFFELIILISLCMFFGEAGAQGENNVIELQDQCSGSSSYYSEACGDNYLNYYAYYNPETGVIGPGENTSGFSAIGQNLLKFAIVASGLLAVLFIVIGGFVYISAAGNPSAISKAKDMIWNAIIGLVIVIGSVLILWTINPDLINLDLDIPVVNIGKKENLPEVQINPSSVSVTKETIDAAASDSKKAPGEQENIYKCVDVTTSDREKYKEKALIPCPENGNKLTFYMCATFGADCNVSQLCCQYKK